MNQKTYKNSQQIFHLIVRVSKKDSAFLYFQLESHEGLCFYSTIKESIGTTHRDLEISGAIEYRKEILHLIHQLQEQFPILTITDEIILDH